MDNRAGEMGVFVAVAETSGFSAAGRRLNLSPSAVSKLIARLEERLGTPLFARSTRKFQLTAEGSVYLEHARRILADIDHAERLVSKSTSFNPTGKLRISTSAAFGECCVLPLVSTFLQRYPEIQLDLSFTDEVVDIFDDRTDIALRSGPLRDSRLMARKLLDSRHLIVASPGYLSKNGTPDAPDDLRDHQCLRLNYQRKSPEWPFLRSKMSKPYMVPVSGKVEASSGVTLRKLALAGVGLTRLVDYHVARDISEGRLVPVLEDFNPGDTEPLHAVYVGHDHLSARIRAFIDFLSEFVKPACFRPGTIHNDTAEP